MKWWASGRVESRSSQRLCRPLTHPTWLMQGDSVIEEPLLDYNMTNYVSWYCFIYQNQGKAIKITNALKEVLGNYSVSYM